MSRIARKGCCGDNCDHEDADRGAQSPEPIACQHHRHHRKEQERVSGLEYRRGGNSCDQRDHAKEFHRSSGREAERTVCCAVAFRLGRDQQDERHDQHGAEPVADDPGHRMQQPYAADGLPSDAAAEQRHSDGDREARDADQGEDARPTGDVIALGPELSQQMGGQQRFADIHEGERKRRPRTETEECGGKSAENDQDARRHHPLAVGQGQEQGRRDRRARPEQSKAAAIPGPKDRGCRRREERSGIADDALNIPSHDFTLAPPYASKAECKNTPSWANYVEPRIECKPNGVLKWLRGR